MLAICSEAITLASLGIGQFERAIVNCERRDSCPGARDCAVAATRCPSPREAFNWLLDELRAIGDRVLRETTEEHPLPSAYKLSKRETEILVALASGCDSVKQIVRFLSNNKGIALAESTVKAHLYRAMKKIDAPNRMVAALWVQRQGWNLEMVLDFPAD